MISVQHLTKRFGTTVAVRDASFAIAPGEIYALIGPNSSGKTTIVKSIMGLLRIDGGAILVDGHDVEKEPIATKSVLGYVPDEPSVWGSMTGEEFLHVVGALYGMKPKEREERIRELLPLFGLTDLAGEYFEDYSRGNKQKFSLLSGFLHAPKALLIDEPIVGLDPESAEIAKGEFKKFAKNGGSLLLVTHTLPVAEEIAMRVGVLSGGRLFAEGTLSELRSRAGLSASADLSEIYSVLTEMSTQKTLHDHA